MKRKEKIRAEVERMHQEAVLAAIGNETDWLRSRIGTLVDVLAVIEDSEDLENEEWLKDRDGCFWDGVNEGKKAMEEQMMKEAVEYEVGMHGEPIKITLDKYVQRAKGIFPGDKVRIIIIKGNEK